MVRPMSERYGSFHLGRSGFSDLWTENYYLMLHLFQCSFISFLSHVWTQAQKTVWTHSPPDKGPISTDITLWQNECLGYCQFPTPPPPFCLFVCYFVFCIFIFSISFGSFCVLELCNWTLVVDLEIWWSLVIFIGHYGSCFLLLLLLLLSLCFRISRNTGMFTKNSKFEN